MTNLIDVSFSNEGSEVIDLTYVKTYAIISTDSFDTLLTDLIKSARMEVEKTAQISIVTKTVRAEWSEVSDNCILPYPKINSITSLVSGTTTLILDSDYKVKGQDKKTIYGTFSDGLVATYTAGYGSNTPEDLKRCIAKKVLEDFEQRTGISSNQSYLLPNNWQKVALSYRPTWLMF